MRNTQPEMRERHKVWHLAFSCRVKIRTLFIWRMEESQALTVADPAGPDFPWEDLQYQIWTSQHFSIGKAGFCPLASRVVVPS